MKDVEKENGANDRVFHLSQRYLLFSGLRLNRSGCCARCQHSKSSGRTILQREKLPWFSMAEL